MELRHLQYVVAVAERGGFVRAAEHLRVAQPSLSRQVAQVERELGGALFERSPRRTTLTALGKTFVSDAREILRSVDEATERARRASGAHHELRVDFVPSAFAWAVPEILRLYQAGEPGGALKLTERRPHEVVDALTGRSADAGFIHQARIPDTDVLAVETVLHEKLLAAVPADHALAARSEIEIGELAGDSFVLNQDNARGGLRTTIVDLCRAAGFDPKIAQDAWLQQTTIGLVSAGLGVTLVTESATRTNRAGVAYIPLANCTSRVTVDLLWHKDTHNPRTRRFVETARQWAASAKA